MLTIQNTIIGTLESVKDKLESSNEAVQKREKIFAKQVEEEEEHDEAENFEKFKKVGFELLDIGIFYGKQGAEQVRSLPLYQKVDAAVNLEDKFALVLKQGEQLYTLLDQKFRPLVNNVFFLFDSVTGKITSYIKCITTKHEEISDYVTKTYSAV